MSWRKEEDDLSLFYIESISSKFAEPLILRMTLGEMPLADGFYAGFDLRELPEDMNVMELIARAIRIEPDEADVKLNPDLPDVLDSLRGLFREETDGLVNIRYYLNGMGETVNLSESLRSYLVAGEIKDRSYKILDLVLEVRETFDPLGGVPEPEREEFLLSIKSAYLLYRLNKSTLTTDEISERVRPILDNLLQNGLVEIEGERYVLTSEGEEAVELLFEEASYYISRYEIFGDVEIDGDEIRFNTGNGVNLIARAMEHDGILPQRAFFILAIYFGHLDDMENWQEEIFSEDLLRGIFWDIFHSPSVEEIGEGTLERIMAAAEYVDGGAALEISRALC
jgi:hypothetical protein